MSSKITVKLVFYEGYTQINRLAQIKKQPSIFLKEIRKKFRNSNINKT